MGLAVAQVPGETDVVTSGHVTFHRPRKVHNGCGGPSPVLGEGVTRGCRNAQEPCRGHRYASLTLQANGSNRRISGLKSAIHRPSAREVTCVSDGATGSVACLSVTLSFLSRIVAGKNWIFKEVITRDQCHLDTRRDRVPGGGGDPPGRCLGAQGLGSSRPV